MAFINSTAAAVFGSANADEIDTRAINGSFSTIYGGLGNDVYYVDAFYENGATDTPADVIVEAVGGGLDTVKLFMFYDTTNSLGNTSYTLADNVDNLDAVVNSSYGYHAFNLTGNDLANKINVIGSASDTPVTLNGLAGNDTLIGGAGNDSLFGGSGIDSMVGGNGEDSYYIDNVLDKVVETATGGIDRAFSSVSYTLGTNVEELRLDANSGNTNATGNASNNTLYGSNGNNTLNGLAGNDRIYGFDGNDVLNGGDGNDILKGDNGNDTLNGAAGNDVLYGNYISAFIDKLDGGAGDDFYRIYSANDVIADTGIGGNDTVFTYSQLNGDLSTGIENLELYNSNNILTGRGNALNNVITGNAYHNILFGLTGNDTLNGGLGNDLMRGGAGNDVYIVNSAGDAAVEDKATDGIDRVESAATFTLGAHIENLTLTGGFFINGYGNTLANKIIGNFADNSLVGGDGDDTLDGGLSFDTLVGGNGNDTYVVDNFSDVVIEAGTGIDTVQVSNISFDLTALTTVENLTLTGFGAYSGTGNNLANVITGNGNSNDLTGGDGNDTIYGGVGIGNDVLIGGNGIDKLIGGDGNDKYYLPDTNDLLVELANQGTDSVYSSVSFSLAAIANVENLALFDVAAAISGTGNALNNSITGNVYNNVLIGLAGNDVLAGGAGNDTLDGGIGNDTLDGGSGGEADTMTGGLGNDTYVLDTLTDLINEGVAAGTDTVLSYITGALSLTGSLANIENATLANGFLGTDITGNAFANVLIGNQLANSIDGGANNDTLDGGAGADSLVGGANNDVYIVDDIGDVVTELAGVGGGIDRIESSISFSLQDTDGAGLNGGNVENITLTGAGNIFADGNSGNNMMIGNSGNNDMLGFAGNDTLIGGLGNDSLYGGIGADSLVGGAGNDIYEVDNALDKVLEGIGAGYDLVYSSLSFTLSANIEELKLDSMGGNINGTGNAIDNRIYGNSGNNSISGLGGDDFAYGGYGNDVLNGGDGNDDLRGGADNDTLLGGNGNDQLNGGDGINKLDGGAGNDLYLVYSASDIVADTGVGGNDTVVTYVQLLGDLGAGIEQLQLNSSVITGRGNVLNNTIYANNENNILFGLAGNDYLGGEGGNDTLIGGDGNDTLHGGTGDDSLNGGLGNDTYYVDSLLDVVTEDSVTGGLDTVFSTVTFTLGANVENLTLQGFGSNGFGNAHNNVITGNAYSNVLRAFDGNDTLDGGIGLDQMYGGNGSDTYYVDNSVDYVNESYGVTDGVASIDTVRASANFDLLSRSVGVVENLILTGTANISGEGNNFDNTITGNSGNNSLTGGYGSDTLFGGLGNDTLNGGAVADSMIGGLGDDFYLVNNNGDKVIELLGQGTDTVESNLDFSLALLSNIENLTLIGGAGLGTGNALNNVIIGNTITNTLIGGAGNDVLYGNGDNDSLDGGDGLDLLDGGTGDDTMRGGLGNDTYIVDSVGDVVTETTAGALGGIDTVFSSESFTLGNNLENLVLLGNVAAFGGGNSLNNRITGTAAAGDLLFGYGGNDTLDGGLLADTMNGDSGADVYYVDDVMDFVQETNNVEIDSVFASVSFDMLTRTAGFVENLTLTGTADIDGGGNNIANNITGNSGNNSLTGGFGNDTLNGGLGNDSLDGGIGVDSLVGGLGDDIYYVDNALDKVIELAGQGTDYVYAAVSFSLATFANVEDLILDDVALALNGTGNALNNYLQGNSFNNLLIGGDGNDTLDGGNGGIDTVNGGAGNDFLIGSVLTGGTGNDTYLFTGTETIIENALQGIDTIISTAASSLSLSGAFAHIDHAEIQNIAALNIIGNGLNNLLTGNSSANLLDGSAGNDTLNGGFGIDTLIGGIGNDVFIVGDSANIIQEASGGGIDRVDSAIGFDLNFDAAGQEIENLTLTGTGNIHGGGSALANIITGNSGNNVLSGYGGNDTIFGGLGNDLLDGGQGIDSMTGGLGNDTYFVDNASDKVIEGINAGNDTVYSFLSFNLNLNANIENVILVDNGNTTATGNAFNNVLDGYGAGNNILLGAAGNDTLLAGDGSDVLTGGTGNDVFRFDNNYGAGLDIITDFTFGQDNLQLMNLAGLTFTGAGSTLTADQFALSTEAGTGDFIIYNQSTGDLFYDATGSGIAANQIFDFTGIAPVLSSTDIFG